MNLSVISGKNLNPKDSNGFSDPYVIVPTCHYIFSITLNPTCDHLIDFIGLPGDSIKFLVYDLDLSKDDFMGSATHLISSTTDSSTQLSLELSEDQINAGSLEIAFIIK